jgi:hypothetical protein
VRRPIRQDRRQGQVYLAQALEASRSGPAGALSYLHFQRRAEGQRGEQGCTTWLYNLMFPVLLWMSAQGKIRDWIKAEKHLNVDIAKASDELHKQFPGLKASKLRASVSFAALRRISPAV